MGITRGSLHKRRLTGGNGRAAGCRRIAVAQWRGDAHVAVNDECGRRPAWALLILQSPVERKHGYDKGDAVAIGAHNCQNLLQKPSTSELLLISWQMDCNRLVKYSHCSSQVCTGMCGRVSCHVLMLG